MITKIDVDRQFIFNPAVCVMLRAELIGSIPIDSLEHAIKNTTKKYELLNSKILEDECGNFYFAPIESPLTPQIIIENAFQTTEEFIQTYEKQFFDLDRGDLIKFIIQRKPHSLLLSICLHHLAGDGKSALYLLEDILLNLEMQIESNVLSNSSINSIPIHVFSKKYLHTLCAQSNIPLPFAKNINKRWEKENFVPNLADKNKLFYEYWKNAQTFSISKIIPAQETKYFCYLCKKNKVTVNSTLITMIVKKLRVLKNFLVAMDFRNEEYSGYGNYSVASRISLYYQQDQSFWENAIRIHKLLKKSYLDKKTLSQQLLFNTYFESSLLNSAFLQKENLIDNEVVKDYINSIGSLKEHIPLVISNIGINPIKEKYSTFEIQELSFVSPIFMQLDCNIGIITSNGKMAINMLYRKNEINYSELLSNVVEQIHHLSTSEMT